MKVRKKSEIEAEIRRLQDLPLVGTHAELMKTRVRLVIEVLQGKKPVTMSPSERELVAEAWRWREGMDDILPSQGWQSFVRS